MVKDLRTLGCAEMVAAGDAHKLRVWQRACDELAVAVADHVPFADNHQCRHGQGGKRLRRDVRMVDHQPQQRAVLPGLVRERGKQTAAAVSQNDGQLGGELDAAGLKVCAVEDQRLHPLGMGKGEGQRQIAPVRKAQQVRLCNLQMVHQGQQVGGKDREVELSVPAGGLPLSAGVHQHQTEVRGKGGDLLDKIGVVLPVAVQQDEGGGLRVCREVFGIKNVGSEIKKKFLAGVAHRKTSFYELKKFTKPLYYGNL